MTPVSSPADHGHANKAEPSTDLPGHLFTEAQLRAEGFTTLNLEVRRFGIELPAGSGCEWTTTGHVPTGPDLYAFTVEDKVEFRVAYVGLTEELWMVTKGRLPTGGARGGQRYGRPRYAGVTRQRVNTLIAAQLQAGRVVRHWLRPLVDDLPDRSGLRHRLLHAEQALILRWDLRRVGWNRG
jgi:hypothetical protein